MTINKVLELWNSDVISTNDVAFYICERFHLKNGIDFSVEDSPSKLVKTENEATWDRIFNEGTLKDRILNNRFLDDNPRLKSRIYLGIKRNDPTLLKYYYDNYAIVKKNNIKKLDVGRSVCLKLYERAPMSLDGRRMEITNHILTIKNRENVTICVIYMDGVIEMVQSDETMDLEFLLPSPDIFSSIYTTIHPSNKRRLDYNEHRRPKIRRRLAFK